jgi:hypothetical protein
MRMGDNGSPPSFQEGSGAISQRYATGAAIVRPNSGSRIQKRRTLRFEKMASGADGQSELDRASCS